MPGVTSRPAAAGPSVGIRWRVQLDEAPLAMRVSSDGSWLAVGTGDGALTVIDTDRGLVQRHWAAHAFGTLAVAWSPDGTTLVSGGQDGIVRFWDHQGDAQRAAAEGGAPPPGRPPAGVGHLGGCPGGARWGGAAR
ncbi:MAG: WD40 repeat domain-containing protein, partial [Gemmatimonas sp.]